MTFATVPTSLRSSPLGFQCRRFPTHDTNAMLELVGFLDQTDGPVPANCNRYDHTGEQYRITQGQQREGLGHLLFASPPHLQLDQRYELVILGITQSPSFYVVLVSKHMTWSFLISILRTNPMPRRIRTMCQRSCQVRSIETSAGSLMLCAPLINFFFTQRCSPAFHDALGGGDEFVKGVQVRSRCRPKRKEECTSVETRPRRCCSRLRRRFRC